MALNDRQQRFVAEYLIDLNATAAYKRAGYKAKGNSAEAAAARLLRNGKVAKAIAAAQAKRASKLELSAERVLQELTRIGLADLRKAAKWDADGLTLTSASDLDDDTAAAIESISFRPGRFGSSVSIKMHPKATALKLLAEHLGLLQTEKTPLDVLLDSLPADLSDAVRRALAESLSRDGAPGGGGSSPTMPAAQ